MCGKHWERIHCGSKLKKHQRSRLTVVCANCLKPGWETRVEKVLRWGAVIPFLWFVGLTLHPDPQKAYRPFLVAPLALLLSWLWFNLCSLRVRGDLFRLFVDIKKHVFGQFPPRCDCAAFFKEVLTGANMLSVLCTFFGLVCAVLFAFLLAHSLGVEPLQQFYEPVEQGPHFDVPFEAGYPLFVEGFAIAELAFLAEIPYGVYPGNQSLFYGWQKLPQFTQATAQDELAFMVFKNNDVLVVAIPGGLKIRHLVQNCLLFGNSIVFKILSEIIPSTALDDLPVFLDFLADLPAYLWQTDTEPFFDLLHDTLQRLRTEYPQCRFILLGHGRGGAFASLMGAGYGIPTVVFGSPGIELLRFRFAEALPPLEHASALSAVLLSVKMESDPLTELDQMSNYTESLVLPCASNLLQCHSMQYLAAQLRKPAPTRTHSEMALSRHHIALMRHLFPCWGFNPLDPCDQQLKCF